MNRHGQVIQEAQMVEVSNRGAAGAALEAGRLLPGFRQVEKNGVPRARVRSLAFCRVSGPQV